MIVVITTMASKSREGPLVDLEEIENSHADPAEKYFA
jgi:hypothetical protein